MLHKYNSRILPVVLYMYSISYLQNSESMRKSQICAASASRLHYFRFNFKRSKAKECKVPFFKENSKGPIRGESHAHSATQYE